MADKKEQSLVKNGTDLIPGAQVRSEFEKFISEGFSQIETVLFGDTEANKMKFYIGVLTGPADPVPVGEEKINPRTGEVTRNVMPCWVFKPMGKTFDGQIGVVENITHVAPCNYQVDAACKRVWDTCERQGKKAVLSIEFIGAGKIKGGARQLNRYRIFERYYDRDAVITG